MDFETSKIFFRQVHYGHFQGKYEILWLSDPFQRENHKEIYEHLTKFNTKKKKSETNANCEMFAQQIEEQEGRKDVSISY